MKMKSPLLLFLAVQLISLASSTTATTFIGKHKRQLPAKSNMEVQKVVPDILDHVPAALATVKYGPGVEMKDGAELTPEQVKATPTEVSWPAQTNALYTVLLTDPDAPSREHPLMREILHWLVVNVPGNNLANGSTVIDYAGAGPPEGGGLHRYVLTVYKQAARLELTGFDSLKAPTGRYKFSTRDFVTKFHLGQPIAGNFYQAQADEYLKAPRIAALKAALATAKVVPDVVDTAPNGTLSILYADGSRADSGNELTPTQVKEAPILLLWPSEPQSLYTLMMVDPDASNRDFLHWLVINIPGSDLAKGESYSAYIGAGPPKDSGLHRYIFLVYKQTAKIDHLPFAKSTNVGLDGRIGFNPRTFVTDNHLSAAPVAGNFFKAKWDEYVNIMQAQFMAAMQALQNQSSTTPTPQIGRAHV